MKKSSKTYGKIPTINIYGILHMFIADMEKGADAWTHTGEICAVSPPPLLLKHLRILSGVPNLVLVFDQMFQIRLVSPNLILRVEKAREQYEYARGTPRDLPRYTQAQKQHKICQREEKD